MADRSGDDETPDRSAMITLAVQAHQLIGAQLGRDLYSAPAFDMLLELYVSDRRPRSLTHLCGAANAPVRTALRMINRMAERDLVTRTADPLDARRVNAALTDSGAQLLDLYFDLLLRSFIVAKVIG